MSTNLHVRSNPNTGYWGVFASRFYQKGGLGDLVNRAWNQAVADEVTSKFVPASRTEPARDVYIVDVGEPIGYVEYRTGGKFSHSSAPTRRLQIEVEAGTSKLQVAYPTASPGHKATAFTGRGYRPLRLTKSQLRHVAAHERLADGRNSNAVFAGDSEALVQEAWQLIQHNNIQPVPHYRNTDGGQREKQTAYLVNMSRIIGHDQVRGPNRTVVEYPDDHVILIFDSDGDLVTAYPTNHRLPQSILDNRVSK